MKTIQGLLLALSLTAVVCGCNPGTTVVTEGGNVISADGKTITLRAKGQPNAEITAAGDLSIDGKPVAVTPAQRLLLQSYQREMTAMTAEGIAIGKEGAALAGTAVKDAISGALHGDGDKVGKKVEADTRGIQAHAMQLCQRVITLKSLQDSLSQQIPAFKPYASIETRDSVDCNRHD